MSAKSILIVEDDTVLSQVMQNSLQKRHYHVVCKSTVAQAKSALENMATENANEERSDNYFHLAIVDLKLAEEHSLALLPVLRQHNPAMKIVMLTGYASIATAVEAVKLGADNYLPKPATVTEILVALEELAPPAGDTSAENESRETLTEDFSPLSARRMEWEHIQRVLHKNDGNISATARELNMHRRTLQRKLQKNPVKE
ncbi:Photosynthetic apparatus regulatory protein RegA [Thalassocella blandensis]|nr:Photosynthetic apparatus regulatory protein RegA [Thalassocella blandensis]